MVEKPIFNGLLHRGLPDLSVLYKMPKIPMTSRNNGLQANWPDPLSVPTDAWYDYWLPNYVAPSHKIIMFDHEAWPYGTQAERQATANKYVEVYTKIKQRRPDLRIGWYMDPIRRDYWNATKPVSHVDYLGWQTRNNELSAIMAPYTDVFMPSLYFFYTRDTTSGDQNCNAAGLYLEANLAETRRIRRVYGKHEAPIYPYVWWRKHDNTRDLDADIWELILREVLDAPTGADGIILWGGWLETWNETAPWWVAVKSRLLDKRRLG